MSMRLLIATTFLFSHALLAQSTMVESQTTVQETDKGTTKVETIKQKVESPQISTDAASDMTITTAVKSGIASVEELAPFALNVTTKDKQVSLQGVVNSLNQLELAVMTAASVKDVKNVLSDGLTVKGMKIPPSGPIITGNVKGALVREGLMSKEEALALPLQVEVSQGAITVSGSLNSEDMKTFVLKAIDTTAGGKTVTSKLTVINKPAPE